MIELLEVIVIDKTGVEIEAEEKQLFEESSK